MKSETSTFKGEWWLPDARDNAIIGTLTFDRAAGLELDAIGLLKDPFEAQAASQVFPIIYGRTTDSKDITLCRCIETGSTWGTGVSVSTFSAQVAFVGAHIDSLEAARFRRAYAALVHLPRWSGITGIQQVLSFRPTGESVERLTHEFSFPAEHPAQIEDWELRFVAGVHTELDVFARAVIEQTLAVQLEFTSPKGFDEIANRLVRHIQDFLSLAVGRVTSLLELSVVRAGEDPKREAIRVLYSQGRRTTADKTVEPEKMVFTFKDVRDQWPEPLRRHFAAREEVRSAMDLYFAVTNNPGLYLEVQFLNLAQAVESLHRGTHAGKLLSEDQFEVVRARVEALLLSPELSLPRDPRLALCNKVKYWNEVSLRRRLRETLRALRPAAQAVVDGRLPFIDAIVDARNYLTHRDPSLRDSTADVPALIHLTRKLRFVVEQSLLRTIGVSDAVLDRHATRTGKDIAGSRVVG